jgi:hypothetical protein
MNTTVEWSMNLRDGGSDGEILHAIQRFTDGQCELDGVVIQPQHIKGRLGATVRMWAEEPVWHTDPKTRRTVR